MNKHQFFHNRSNNYTISVVVDFTRDNLLELLTMTDKRIFVKSGIAYVHPKDNYCKAIGREVSVKKEKDIHMNLLYVKNLGENLEFTFNSNMGRFTFKTSHKSNKPHFINHVVFYRPYNK